MNRGAPCQAMPAGAAAGDRYPEAAMERVNL